MKAAVLAGDVFSLDLDLVVAGFFDVLTLFVVFLVLGLSLILDLPAPEVAAGADVKLYVSWAGIRASRPHVHGYLLFLEEDGEDEEDEEVVLRWLGLCRALPGGMVAPVAAHVGR